MYITDLKAGDEILITLSKNLSAYPLRYPSGKIVYKTNVRNAHRESQRFVHGTGKVISNSNNVLKISFTQGWNKSQFSGVAEIDYQAVSLLYLYQGETNASTVAKGLDNPATAPPMNIYRKKVVLRWTS